MVVGGSFFRQLYFKSTGYSFTHMGRLFLRLFIGLMLAQFGIRQLQGIPAFANQFDCVPLVSYGLEHWLVVVVELVCSFFIMIGLFTRLMLFPPFILMIVSAHKVIALHGWNALLSVNLLTVPFLFMGVYAFFFLVGPGKISIDYFYSLYLINRHHDREEDLEEV